MRFIKLTLGMFTIRKSFSNRTARIEIQYGFGEVLDLARSNIEIGCTGFWSVVNEYIFLFFFFFLRAYKTTSLVRSIPLNAVLYIRVCVYFEYSDRVRTLNYSTHARRVRPEKDLNYVNIIIHVVGGMRNPVPFGFRTRVVIHFVLIRKRLISSVSPQSR